MKKILLALAASFAITGLASAQTAAGNVAEKLPMPVQLAVSGGMKLEKSFAAPGGMKGWLLTQGFDQQIIVYTTADGAAAVAGTMMDATGQNLTKQHLEQYGPKPNYEQLWTEMQMSTWVPEGAKGKDVKSVIYVFEDSNCSYCHLMWKALQPYLKAGLQVRWLPVAFLAADSYDKAALLMSAKDPDAARTELHNNWGKRIALPTPTPEQRMKVDSNNKLMKTWGFRGTPATFYKDKSGKVQVVNGMPRLSQMSEITGLPAIPNTDPELARFK